MSAFRLERGEPGFRHLRGDRPRHVGGDHRPLPWRCANVDQRLVVGGVARPWARHLQKLVLGDVPHQKVLEGLLRVALEHLERDDDVAAPPAEPFENRQLQPVGIRVVVLLADEDRRRPSPARRASTRSPRTSCHRSRRHAAARNSTGPRTAGAKTAVSSNAPMCFRISLLPALQCLVVRVAVPQHRPACAFSFSADPDVDHLDEHREAHREVNVALLDVPAEAVGDERHADQQQERQRQDLDGRVGLDERG